MEGGNSGTAGGPSLMGVPKAENSGDTGISNSQGVRLSQFYAGRDDNRTGRAMVAGDYFAAVGLLL